MVWRQKIVHVPTGLVFEGLFDDGPELSKGWLPADTSTGAFWGFGERYGNDVQNIVLNGVTHRILIGIEGEVIYIPMKLLADCVTKLMPYKPK